MTTKFDFQRTAERLFRWAMILRPDSTYCAEALERAAREVQTAHKHWLQRKELDALKPSWLDRLLNPLLRLFLGGGR